MAMYFSYDAFESEFQAGPTEEEGGRGRAAVVGLCRRRGKGTGSSKRMLTMETWGTRGFPEKKKESREDQLQRKPKLLCVRSAAGGIDKRPSPSIAA